jgi:hypothetical protein
MWLRRGAQHGEDDQALALLIASLLPGAARGKPVYTARAIPAVR